jgi:hypothetical protein
VSQNDIFELLKERRLMGDVRFFSALDIRKLLRDNGCCDDEACIYQNLKKLRFWGYVDVKDSIVKRSGKIKRTHLVYRLNDDYL